MKRVFICSPYRGDETLNTYNARTYCKQAIAQGFIPLAPHLYFTQFLEEDIPEERQLGISMGLELMKECEEVWAFYNPLDGPSAGMQVEMDYAEHVLNLPVRHIDPAAALEPIRDEEVFECQPD